MRKFILLLVLLAAAAFYHYERLHPADDLEDLHKEKGSRLQSAIDNLEIDWDKQREEAKKLETDNALYKEAKRLKEENYQKIREVNKKFYGVHSMYETDISGDERVAQILQMNKSTMDTFKQATRQEGYGEILTKFPKKYTLTSPSSKIF